MSKEKELTKAEAEMPMTAEEFAKLSKEYSAEVQSKLDQALKSLQFNNSAENQKKVQQAKEAKSLAQWMNAYAKSDKQAMHKVTQDYIADTGTPEYAGVLVHPLFDEMINRFTAQYTPIYNGSRKVTLRRGQGNVFNSHDLIQDVVANWGAEGAMKNVTRAKYSQPTVKLDKLQGIVISTDEMIADAFLDLPSFLAERMARQMGIALEQGLLIGNGANTDGILNTAGVTFLNIGATVADFTYDDMLKGKVEYFKVAREFTNARAYISPDMYGNILLAKDNEGAYLVPNTNPSAVSPTGVTPAFLGQVPYEVSPDLPSTGLTTGDAIGFYTDLSAHSIVVEKDGMEVTWDRSASVSFEDDQEQEVTFNAFQQDGTLGRFVRRVAGLVVNPSGIVVYRLGAESGS